MMGITGLIKSAIGVGGWSRRNNKRKRIKPMSEQERQDSYQVFLKDITNGRKKSKNKYRLK
jgi:hypothetical protein